MVETTDKRKKVTLGKEVHPVDKLINDTLNFVVNHPNYSTVMLLPRPERKRLERGIAKALTRSNFKERPDAKA